MRHYDYKEWFTCDRCKKIIKEETFSIFKFPIFRYEAVHVITTKNYDLCQDCRKAFERFMKNEDT